MCDGKQACEKTMEGCEISQGKCRRKKCATSDRLELPDPEDFKPCTCDSGDETIKCMNHNGKEETCNTKTQVCGATLTNIIKQECMPTGDCKNGCTVNNKDCRAQLCSKASVMSVPKIEAFGDCNCLKGTQTDDASKTQQGCPSVAVMTLILA